MASLYESISSNVSPKYHKRIREILNVVNSKASYTVKATRHSAVFKRTLEMLTQDRNGYMCLDHNLTTLNGNITTYPTVRVTGDFVVALVKCRLMNPTTKHCKYENTIIIYEKKESEYDKMRGVS